MRGAAHTKVTSERVKKIDKDNTKNKKKSNTKTKKRDKDKDEEKKDGPFLCEMVAVVRAVLAMTSSARRYTNKGEIRNN